MSITLVCNTCKRDLTFYLDSRMDRIEIDPCQNCLDAKEREAYAQGQKDMVSE